MSPLRTLTLFFRPLRECALVGLAVIALAACNETPTPAAIDGVGTVAAGGGADETEQQTDATPSGDDDKSGDSDSSESNQDSAAGDADTGATANQSTLELPLVDTNGALRAEITRVPDGDSFEAVVNGREERIRMIGMNTPEGDECFGEEAGDELRRLIGGRTVDLVTPLGERDDFDRILAYVIADGDLINALLVRDGFALARDQSGHRLAGDFETLEADARATQRGVWSPSACGVPISTSVAFGDFEPNAPGPDDENLNGEWIDIVNGGSNEAELGGWTVKDESTRHRYVFDDDIVLGPGDTLRLFTGCGDDGGGELFWCDQTSVWNNGGDTAFLLDVNGNIVDSIAYS